MTKPRRLPRGVLVAFEGIDGSGKTTQATLLEGYLRGQGFEVSRSKEPTHGAWGMKLRASKSSGRMSPRDELAHFINDRKEHVQSVIAPALARGAVVIIDRYYYSTVAYQGARGLDPKELLAANRAFAPKPDLLVLLDVEPQVGLDRIHGRGDRHDLFENLTELTKAREIFLSLNEAHLLKLDGTLPAAEIHAAIVARLRQGPLAGIG
ncbi:MAG: dTMP kinase [Deltaproteobacteria bacterium]|nr:dTMP kinase [Deltaproteobacteria bacterium]